MCDNPYGCGKSTLVSILAGQEKPDSGTLFFLQDRKSQQAASLRAFGEGAAYESGLDNSPLYSDIPFDAENHLLRLWDVGLNGLYMADYQALAELAGVIGRAAGVDRLMGLNAKKRILHTDVVWNPRQERSLGAAGKNLAFKEV